MSRRGAILQKLGVESRTQAVIAAAKISGGQWRQGTATVPRQARFRIREIASSRMNRSRKKGEEAPVESGSFSYPSPA
jgi:hypothetical protein